MLPEISRPPQDQNTETCRHCGAIDRPVLGPGRGPHACEARCAHCGKHLRWVSLLAPSERVAHRLHARLQAMRQHPPTEKQMEYLKALGDKLAAPATMAEASERIEALKRGKG
jgi:hypothetical protein